MRLIAPEAVVCLGATAAHALVGNAVQVGRDRGQPLDSGLAAFVTVTAHPSSILRMRDAEDRSAALSALARDLAVAAARLGGHGRGATR